MPSLLLLNMVLRLVSWRLSGVRIGRRSWIKSPIRMGEGSWMGWGCSVRGDGNLVIGKYCAIGESVRVITSNHDMDRLTMNYLVQDKLVGERFHSAKSGVVIGNDVWIGDSAILLPGITIGDGAVIGAGAVVSRSVDPYTVAAGNPARPIRKRFTPELEARIRQLAWWDWDAARMRANAHLFSIHCSSHPEAMSVSEAETNRAD
jgi:acetyltransferase-like isoleucine patch superfamily enzyme